MSQVTFDATVGGDGTVVSDDASPTTGLANGGFWTRLVPMFTNVVNIAKYVRDQGLLVLGYKNDANNSAGLANTRANAAYDSQTAAADSATQANASKVLASEWAMKTTGTVDGTYYGARKYALDAEFHASTAAAITGLPLPTGITDAGKAIVVNPAGNGFVLGSASGLGDALFYSGM
jgi:hypothetical protein